MRRSVVLAAIVAAVTVVLLPGTQNVSAGGSCAVVPTLRDSAVDQGVGGTTVAGYAPLVRGKDTLVRFYLSNPSCSSSQLQILDASLSATIANSDGTTKTIGPFASINPYAADASGNFPVASPYTAAPITTDTTSDPRFVAPGYLLAASTTAAFRVTFNLTGHFRIGATGASAAFGPLSTTGSFDQKTRALRVLVVKMGDPNGISTDGVCPTGATCVTYPNNLDPNNPTAPGTPQHPEFDNASVSLTQNALSSVERELPLPSGATAGAAPTGDLNGASGGLRYTFNLASSCGTTVVTCGMLNLAAIPDPTRSGGRLLESSHHFCGTAGNFSSIQTQLTNMLNA